MTAPLPPKTRAVLAWLTEIAEIGEPCPYNLAIARHCGIASDVAVSHQLKILRDAGVITIETVGIERVVTITATGRSTKRPERMAATPTRPRHAPRKEEADPAERILAVSRALRGGAPAPAAPASVADEPAGAAADPATDALAPRPAPMAPPPPVRTAPPPADPAPPAPEPAASPAAPVAEETIVTPDTPPADLAEPSPAAAPDPAAAPFLGIDPEALRRFADEEGAHIAARAEAALFARTRADAAILAERALRLIERVGAGRAEAIERIIALVNQAGPAFARNAFRADDDEVPW